MFETNRMKWLVNQPVYPRAGFSNVNLREAPNTASPILSMVNLPNSFGTYTGRTWNDANAPKGVEKIWLEIKRPSGRFGWVRYDMIISNEKTSKQIKDNEALRLLWNIVETDKKTFKRLLIMREDLENPKFKAKPEYAEAKRQYLRLLTSYNARQAKMQSDKQLFAQANKEPSGLEKLGKKWSGFWKDAGIGEPISLTVIAVIAVIALVAGVSIAYIISTYKTDLAKATEDDINSASTLQAFNGYINAATTPEEKKKREAVVKKAKVELVNSIQEAQDEGEHSGKVNAGPFGNISLLAVGLIAFKILA
ncbi:MAG: SH3 domain-containing protein [Bacteroidetes bacterium]|nr:SH3 domain-containing protein [Bacteroidota bacterium]